MENKDINNVTDGVLNQVTDVLGKIYNRTKSIDFEKVILTESDVADLKLHLGYSKNYSDLAKVRLQYFKTINQLPDETDQDD